MDTPPPPLGAKAKFQQLQSQEDRSTSVYGEMLCLFCDCLNFLMQRCIFLWVYWTDILWMNDGISIYLN